MGRGKSFLEKMISTADENKDNVEAVVEEKKPIIEHREERAHSHVKDNKKKTRTVVTMWLDPEKCRIQQRPNRIYELLTPENCKDLIDSIEVKGQEIPAIARQTGEKDQPYEIVVGRRRHFVATHLQRELLAEVRVMTDEEAFLLSEAENEGRKDLSDYEKALDWADALDNFYGGKVERLATAINKDRTLVYQYINLARLDQVIVDAYDSVLDIKRDHAVKLTSMMKKNDVKKNILAKAKELAKDKMGRPGATTFKLLVTTQQKKSRGGLTLDENITDKQGNKIFNISKSGRGGYAIKFESKLSADKEEIKALLLKAVDEYL